MYCDVCHQYDRGSNVGKTFISGCCNFHLSAVEDHEGTVVHKGHVDKNRATQPMGVRQSEGRKAPLKIKEGWLWAPQRSFLRCTCHRKEEPASHSLIIDGFQTRMKQRGFWLSTWTETGDSRDLIAEDKHSNLLGHIWSWHLFSFMMDSRYMYVCVYVCLFVCLSIHPSVRPSVHPSVRPSIHPSVWCWLVLLKITAFWLKVCVWNTTYYKTNTILGYDNNWNYVL